MAKKVCGLLNAYLSWNVASVQHKVVIVIYGIVFGYVTNILDKTTFCHQLPQVDQMKTLENKHTVMPQRPRIRSPPNTHYAPHYTPRPWCLCGWWPHRPMSPLQVAPSHQMLPWALFPDLIPGWGPGKPIPGRLD